MSQKPQDSEGLPFQGQRAAGCLLAVEVEREGQGHFPCRSAAEEPFVHTGGHGPASHWLLDPVRPPAATMLVGRSGMFSSEAQRRGVGCH